MMRFFSVILIALSLGSARAAPDDLALGLQNLYWGMSPAEAAKLYPALGPVPVPNPKRAAVIRMSQQFQYVGCSGQLALNFYNEHLNNIRFDQVRNSSPCREQVLRELQEKFGPAYPRFPGARLREENLEMRSRTTVASYMHWANDFGDWMIVDMRELFDTSGERYAALMQGDALRRATSCQSVQAEFIPELTPAISYGPTFEPTVRDLNCEYPTLGAALLLQGRVVLQVNILADGTLASGVLVSEKPPGIYARDLSDAAIRIATEKLRFFPAIKDGMPVATEAHLAINFKVTHPLRGL